MYQNLAILAVFAFLYSSFAKGIEQTWVSGPIIFTSFSLLLGPLGAGVLTLDWTSDGLLGKQYGITLQLILISMVCSFPKPSFKYSITSHHNL